MKKIIQIAFNIGWMYALTEDGKIYRRNSSDDGYYWELEEIEEKEGKE